MNDNIKKELERSFEFFWDFSNHNEEDVGYGLIVDRMSKPHICSIASVGFGLTAYVIGAERKLKDYDTIKKHVIKTLETLRFNIKTFKGIYPHFINMSTCEIIGKSEYSTIDTCLLVNGIITVEAYFEDEYLTKLSDEIINRIDWSFFIFDRGKQKLVRMAYNDQKGGAYLNGKNPGFIHQWDHYAEQLTMYMQIALDDNITDEDLQEIYMSFERTSGDIKVKTLFFPYGNPLFIHQFSHAWFPFQKYTDAYGFDWFENSVNATLSHIEFCKDCQYDHLNDKMFGLSAGDIEGGYGVFGAYPIRNIENLKYVLGDGTVQQYAMASSINFVEDKSIAAINNLYENYPECYGKYGFYDGINLKTNWYSKDCLGIDKGVTIIMLDNHLLGTTWRLYEKSKYIKKAIKRLKFKEKK